MTRAAYVAGVIAALAACAVWVRRWLTTSVAAEAAAAFNRMERP